MVEDFQGLGRAAGRRLLRRIEGDAGPPEHLVLPARLRVGATTRPLP